MTSPKAEEPRVLKRGDLLLDENGKEFELLTEQLFGFWTAKERNTGRVIALAPSTLAVLRKKEDLSEFEQMAIRHGFVPRDNPGSGED
jgi:hypothetical protein